MPHHPPTTATGNVTHVFAHRFVLATKDGDILADLTPHGLHRITLAVGDAITIEGETKPSEIKVARVTRGKEIVDIEHHTQHTLDPADRRIVLTATTAAQYELIGEPRRKPKHFEVLGRRDGRFDELHIELDGHLRKVKAAALHDPKWAREIEQAARGAAA